MGICTKAGVSEKAVSGGLGNNGTNPLQTSHIRQQKNASECHTFFLFRTQEAISTLTPTRPWGLGWGAFGETTFEGYFRVGKSSTSPPQKNRRDQIQGDSPPGFFFLESGGFRTHQPHPSNEENLPYSGWGEDHKNFTDPWGVMSTLQKTTIQSHFLENQPVTP